MSKKENSIGYRDEDPDEIFEKLEVLGEGSYGIVWKALHKIDGKICAVKVVKVEDDISEVEKEVKILKQCKSPYIVGYHGTYLKNNKLWIALEYCGGGSLADILTLLQETLTEPQIAAVCAASLKGLEYLHAQKKIHRDIKAGNILMTEECEIKLADFGVSAQLNNTISKRNTVIGTPFWMAPEVIQENKYNGKADVWSLGITAIELAEGKVPLSGIHPLRAMFQIPNKAPPTLTEKNKWSDEFNDFIAQCLTKAPEERPTSKELLKHPFIKKAKNPKILMELIDKLNNKISEAGGRANLMKTLNKKQGKGSGSDDDDSDDSDDFKRRSDSDSDDSDSGTMVRKKNDSDSDDSDSGTMVRRKSHSDSDDSDSGTMVRKKKSKSDSDSDSDSGTGTLVVKKKKRRSDSGDEGTASDGSDGYRVKIPQANSDDSDAEEQSPQKDYYSKWNKELLEQQLSMLEEEYQKELNEIQERYKKKREEIKNAIAKFKNNK
eukprot:gene2831-4238_t